MRITVAASFQNERAFLSYTDVLPALPYVRIIEETHPAWVYITHLMTGADQQEIVSAARTVNARVFMDCQAHKASIKDPVIVEALQRVDVFSPNLGEAHMLTGETDILSSLNKLVEFTPLVIIKDGIHGCLASNSGQVIRSESIKVDVKDTTGAGDNFNCGFLFGQISGFSLEKSLRAANICGGLSTRGIGGSATSTTRAAVATWLDAVRPNYQT